MVRLLVPRSTRHGYAAMVLWMAAALITATSASMCYLPKFTVTEFSFSLDYYFGLSFWFASLCTQQLFVRICFFYNFLCFFCSHVCCVCGKIAFCFDAVKTPVFAYKWYSNTICNCEYICLYIYNRTLTDVRGVNGMWNVCGSCSTCGIYGDRHIAMSIFYAFAYYLEPSCCWCTHNCFTCVLIWVSIALRFILS